MRLQKTGNDFESDLLDCGHVIKEEGIAFSEGFRRAVQGLKLKIICQVIIHRALKQADTGILTTPQTGS